MIPARALGAPQTICFSPSAVSTRQTRSLSASGCGVRLEHLADGEGGEPLGGIAHALDLEPEIGQREGDLVERGGGVEMLLEPGEGEFHDVRPIKRRNCARV